MLNSMLGTWNTNKNNAQPFLEKHLVSGTTGREEAVLDGRNLRWKGIHI